MKTPKLLVLLAASAAFTAAVFAADAPAPTPPAESKVTLSEVHICCGSCVNGVNSTLAKVAGVKGTPSQADGTIVLTAADKPTLQKAVDALVAAGFYGKSSDASIKVVDDTGAKVGKVQTLDISGVHLCCAKCVTAVNTILSKVDGVKGNNAVQKGEKFTVTGDFDPTAVFAALNKGGLAGKVAAPAPAAK
jgi:copper chaperone CopZ